MMHSIYYLRFHTSLIARGYFQHALSFRKQDPSFGSIYNSRYISSVSSEHRGNPPYNTLVNFVPQQEVWIVERFGKFHKSLEPGLNILIPFIDTIKYVQSLKETAIEIPSQSAISEDNVTLNIDGVLYYKVDDPYLASYGVEDGEFAIVQLAQTTMRSELGKIKLDKVFQERTALNLLIVDAINTASNVWGIRCLRYEIKDISLPPKVKEAMQMQVEAERKKRATILESEGTKESAINVAFGEKQATILASEAVKIERINKAAGQAEADILNAQAKSRSLELVAEALGKDRGNNAASLLVAQQYVTAFTELAKHTNAMILPSDTGNVSSMVAQAMTIYSTLSQKHYLDPSSPPQSDTPKGVDNNTTAKKEEIIASSNQTSPSLSGLSKKANSNSMSVFDSPTRIS